MSVHLSRAEIKSEVEKAIRGVGVDWGRAKDGGIMAAWLAAHDNIFLGSLLRILDTIDTNPKDASFSYGAIDGMVLAEYVLSSQQDWTGHVVAPRYLVAGMGIVTKEQGGTLALFDDSSLCAYAENGEVFMALDADMSDGFFTLSQNMPMQDHKACQLLNWSDATTHIASASCWARLNKLAFRVYVPETEEKRRSGAGAGDIDNS